MIRAMSSRLLLAILVITGCGGTSGTGPDGATPCTSDGQCTAPTAACDIPSGTCVQCTDTNVMACSGATPACAPDHTCEKSCAADTDCASGACLGDGTCADPDAVLWVTRDVAAGTCTLQDKCTLAVALTMVTATKNVIHLDPLGYHFAAGFTLQGHFTMTGAGDGVTVASIAVDTGNVFLIPSQNAVTIDFLQFGGTATTQPDEGVECTNGTFFARKIGIAFTKGIAINASGCGFRLERSIIHDAAGGAIEVGGGAVSTMFDNMIFRNGSATAAVGGVFFAGSVDPASRFEFNTIVDNAAATGALDAGGVFCGAVFAGANNIIARNSLGGVTTGATAQTNGECTYPTSLVQSDLAGLAFASPDTAPFSYKLTAGSMAVDMATTASTVDVDFEGDARPQGAQDDIGADELKQ
jgi:hypothetical protein